MLVATYSLCACDLERGEWGVVVQSKFLAVGSVVSWAEATSGAVATQAWANPRYGPDGLVLLREGAMAVAFAAAMLAGNLAGLARGRRYMDRDLNRGWTGERLATLRGGAAQDAEDREQLELAEAIERALA